MNTNYLAVNNITKSGIPYDKTSVLNSAHSSDMIHGSNFIGWQVKDESDNVTDHFFAKNNDTDDYSIYMQRLTNKNGESSIFVDKNFDGMFDSAFQSYNDENGKFGFYAQDIDADGIADKINNSLDGWCTIASPDYLTELYSGEGKN